MKRFAALIAALMLVFALGSALAQAKKTEIVYAKLDNAGKLLDLYIVNAFEAQEAEQRGDYGSYSELINLSGTEALTSQDDQVRLNLKPGRSYYQGKPTKQMLPWQFDLSYTLDGAAIQPKDLPGAKGRLGMTLSVQVVDELAAFARSNTLQISLSLDGDRSLNIDAPHATMAYAGGNVTLAFVVLPGQSASYSISADVDDFAMPGLQIAGLRMGMDVEQYKKAIEGGMQGNPMAQSLGPVVENFVKGMAGESPRSFADSRNGAVEGLQFVILSEGVAEKPKEVETTDAVEQSQEQTVMTRFLALFFD